MVLLTIGYPQMWQLIINFPIKIGIWGYPPGSNLPVPPQALGATVASQLIKGVAMHHDQGDRLLHVALDSWDRTGLTDLGGTGLDRLGRKKGSLHVTSYNWHETPKRKTPKRKGIIAISGRKKLKLSSILRGLQTSQTSGCEGEFQEGSGLILYFLWSSGSTIPIDYVFVMRQT